jgi:hypothetical protein
MISVQLGEKRVEEKDSEIVIYDIEVRGVHKAEAVVKSLVPLVIKALDDRYLSNERYASESDDENPINSNLKHQTVTFSLRYKGQEIPEDLLSIIVKESVEKIESDN